MSAHACICPCTKEPGERVSDLRGRGNELEGWLSSCEGGAVGGVCYLRPGATRARQKYRVGGLLGPFM
jgi:hypothetical protein